MSRTKHHARGWLAKSIKADRKDVKREKHRDLTKRSITARQAIAEFLAESEFPRVGYGLRSAYDMRRWGLVSMSLFEHYAIELTCPEGLSDDPYEEDFLIYNQDGTVEYPQEPDPYEWTLADFDLEPEAVEYGEEKAIVDVLGWMPRMSFQQLGDEMGWDGFSVQRFERNKPVKTDYEKTRVYEIAKTVGVPSQDIIDLLRGQGEYVKCASSTVPKHIAVRLIREVFPSPSSEDDRTMIAVAILDAQPARRLSYPRPRVGNNPFVTR